MEKTEKTEKRGKQKGYSNRVRLAKLEKRHQDAVVRQRRWDMLSKADKLAVIATRRGESKRELARLNKTK